MEMSKRPAAGNWIDDLLRPAIIAGMLACLVSPAVKVMEWLFIGWDGSYVVVFAFVAGLEGILSERALKKRDIDGYGYLVSRGAELLVLLLVLKLASYFSLGLDRLWADAQLWTADIGQFYSTLDFFLLLIFVPLWVGAIYVARVVRELDVEENAENPPPDKTSVEYYLWMTRPAPLRQRHKVLKWFGELFVWGGIILLLISMALHFLISSAQSLAIPTLLYFTLGIALMSQGQFSALYASWQLQDIPVQKGIARRWLLWVVVFLLIVALVSFLLPTGYALGPLQALLGVFGLLFNILSFLIFSLFFLLALPLSLILPNMERPEEPVFEPAPIVPQSATNSGTSALETILSAIFWVVVLGIVGYALFRFWRDRFGSLSAEEKQATWWGRFVVWLEALWLRWRTWRRSIQTRIVKPRAGRVREQTALRGLGRFFSLGRLPPRELVRYFYLSTTKRAAQAGRARRPEQTPYEYQDSLDQEFPDLEPDLTGLTDAFVQARYSQHPVEQKDAETVRPLWQRIKAALRRRRSRL